MKTFRSRYLTGDQKPLTIINWVVLFIVASTLTIFYFYSACGLDFTDESYNLLNAQQVRFDTYVSSFGVVTGSLLRLSAGDIASFRMAGVVILGLLSALLGWTIENYFKYNQNVDQESYNFSAALCAYFGSLVLFQRWQFTPSYNWLALVSTIIVAYTLINSVNIARKLKFSNPHFYSMAILLGIGGGLAFVAKPTTALLCAPIALIWIAFSNLNNRKSSFIVIALISALGLVASVALQLENSLIQYINKIGSSADLLNQLEAGHTIPTAFENFAGELIRLPYDLWKLIPYTLITGPIIFALFFLAEKSKYCNRLAHQIWLYAFAFAVAAVFIELTFGGHWKKFIGGQSAAAFILPAALTAGILHMKANQRGKRSENYFDFFRLLLLLLFLTAAFSFGSGNGLIRQSMRGFVLLALLLFLLARFCSVYYEQRLAEATVLLIVVSTSLIIAFQGFLQPYRLPNAIRDQTIPITSVNSKYALFLDPVSATYVNDIKSSALSNGWISGMTLIDMTGASPGVAIILGAKVPGTAWLIGGYKGSNNYAHAALSHAPDISLERPWVLTAPLGKRKLDETMLPTLGVDFPSKYIEVIHAESSTTGETHILWRPK